MSGALRLSDQTAIVRDAAVGSLIAYGTLAGDRVEAERIDVVAGGDMPRLIVFADEDSVTASRGGTAPAFDVTMHIVIQALVERARKPDAVADLDALIAQVKDCLFGDPAWVRLTQNIGSVKTQRSFRRETDMILGDGRVQIECSWRETYAPRVTQPLKTVFVTVVVPATTS